MSILISCCGRKNKIFDLIRRLMFFKFDEYPAVDKKKWKEGATVKSRNEPHTIRQVPNN